MDREDFGKELKDNWGNGFVTVLVDEEEDEIIVRESNGAYVCDYLDDEEFETLDKIALALYDRLNDDEIIINSVY